MTATLLTVTNLREHIETGMTDAALQRVLDAEEAEIIRRHGPHATATETVWGGGIWLLLARTPSVITSVTEVTQNVSTLLAADDYTVWSGGRLERSPYGTHPASYWAPRVDLVYAPEDWTAQRRAVLIRLVQLTIQYQGVQAESIGSGDYSMTALDYAAERTRLLNSLATQQIWVV
jgi:hypothetical protein